MLLGTLRTISGLCVCVCVYVWSRYKVHFFIYPNRSGLSVEQIHLSICLSVSSSLALQYPMISASCPRVLRARSHAWSRLRRGQYTDDSKPNELSIAWSPLSVTANKLNPAVTSSERWMLNAEMRNHSAARGIMCGEWKNVMSSHEVLALLYLSATGGTRYPSGVTKAERTVLTPGKNNFDHEKAGKIMYISF